ncbi:hypothetical protein [Parapedobacter soli]|uniref:hypothetical protein n=1 Tax=Parapedobacter soli TaxID=416955 RepID=UPI0021C6926E|nr:hypothetical protein [Parapedobacter soli]
MEDEKYLVSLVDSDGHLRIINKRYIVKVDVNDYGYTSIMVEVPSNPPYVVQYAFNEPIDEIKDMLIK